MEKNESFSGKNIYTLGLNGTGSEGNYIVCPAKIVSGNGSDLTDNDRLQKKAKQKTIAQKVILDLIDDAIKKGKDKWAKSLWNAYRCQSEIVTANGKLYSHYCKYRICPICSSIRKAEKLNHYLPIVKSWPDPYFITLTLKSVPAKRLKPVIESMVKEFRQITDNYKKREQRGTGKRLIGIRSLECNFNPKRRTYNPHYHIIVATKEMAEILLREWLTRSHKGWTHRKGQFVRKTEDKEHDMIETVKYGTKILTEPDPRKKKPFKGKRKVYIAALNNILQAFNGHHLFDRFGFTPTERKIRPERKTTFVYDHLNWEFDSAEADWIDQYSGERLSGYLPESDLLEILKDGIDTELE